MLLVAVFDLNVVLHCQVQVMMMMVVMIEVVVKLEEDQRVEVV